MAQKPIYMETTNVRFEQVLVTPIGVIDAWFERLNASTMDLSTKGLIVNELNNLLRHSNLEVRPIEPPPRPKAEFSRKK